MSIEPVEDRENGANWTVKDVDAGPASQDACERAIDRIAPLVQQHFDLDLEHDSSPDTPAAA